MSCIAPGGQPYDAPPMYGQCMNGGAFFTTPGGNFVVAGSYNAANGPVNGNAPFSNVGIFL